MAITKLHYRQRRERMARFLRNLKPENFNMCTFGEEGACGTVACMAGWCPAVFPDDWQGPAAHCRLIKRSIGGLDRDAIKFFGIPEGAHMSFDHNPFMPSYYARHTNRAARSGLPTPSEAADALLKAPYRG